MKSVTDFLKSHTYAAIWTACYIFVMWAILAWLFGFDMFSAAAWTRLAASHLHGFGGFVFGILVLAAVPMYIATTTVILRNNKPLFTITVPAFIKRAFTPPQPAPAAPTPAPEPAAPAAADDATAAPDDLPPEMPMELRHAYIRARRGGSIRMPASAFDASHASAAPRPTPVAAAMADDFPLPTDFDMDDNADPAPTAPQFTEINFDSPVAPDIPEQPAAEKIPNAAPNDDTNPATDVIRALRDAGRDAAMDGEFVISGDKIIAIHNDPDFWVADDTDWFAAGRTRPNPVTAVAARAAELNLRPVLYLGAQNILDLDERIAVWESNGVRVVTDLKNLGD